MGHCGMATFDRRKSAPKHLLMDIYPARSAAAPASERPLWRRALHFEGRSWTGLHRHALMTMIAYAFLQSRRLKAAGRKKKESRNRRRNRACRQSGKRSSTSSHAPHHDDVLTVRCSSQKLQRKTCQSSVRGRNQQCAVGQHKIAASI